MEGRVYTTNGETLYDMYRRAQLTINNCETESWGELTDDDKAAWEKAASDFYDQII